MTSLFAPLVSTPRSCTPPTLPLPLTSFAPRSNLGVIPPTKALALSPFAPAVATPRLVTPPRLSCVLAAFAPAVSSDEQVEITVASLHYEAPRSLLHYEAPRSLLHWEAPRSS